MNRLIALPTLLLVFMLLLTSPSSNSICTQPAQAQPEGTLILNEISPLPSSGNPWLEILNPTSEQIAVAGWTLEFLSGYSFSFPPNSAAIRPAGLQVLDIPANQLGDRGDVCILRSPDGTATDIIAWGSPPIGDHLPLPPGSPLLPFTGIRHDNRNILQDIIIFRIPDAWQSGSDTYIGSQNWACRSIEAATKGAPNHYPTASVFTPPDGSLIASAIHLAVLDMDSSRQITFQVASDAGFSNIVHSETVSDDGIDIDRLPPGRYYWRVSTAGKDNWSVPQNFTMLAINLDEAAPSTSESPNPSSPSRRLASSKSGGDAEGLMLFGDAEVVSRHVIGINHLVQHKDTDMVCLDGCTMNGQDSWENPQTGPRTHARNYCVRACLAMIASSAGCDLSQDRITYFIFQEAGAQNPDGQEAGHLDDPYKDLGHNLTTYDDTCRYALEWIYDQPNGTAREIAATMGNWDDSDPSDMDTIREFIDDGRPVVRNLERHVTLIDGYAILHDNESGTETVMVHVLDPWRAGFISWLNLDSPEVMSYILPPPTGIPMRCDEPEVAMDSDGDRLVDFDETERFGTNPSNRDSDDDGLDDMTDMLGYLFEPDGSYNPQNRDYDEDRLAKEMDPDNDHAQNDGVEDGCEDLSLNGFFDDDGSETDNFLMADDFDIISRDCYSGFIKIESEVSVPAIPTAVLRVKEIVTIENGQPTSSRQYIYNHWWQMTAEGFVIPMFGGEIRSMVDGYGSTDASIQIDVQPNGHYRMVTDTNPRVVQYTITTTAPGMGDRMAFEDFYLYCANHHYGYVSPEAPPIVEVMEEAAGRPNIFEGQVTRDPDGGVRIAGNDLFDASAFIEGISGTSTRTWEIWIERPD